jgi:DNA-binding Lrp family transcriptional regulator
MPKVLRFDKLGRMMYLRFIWLTQGEIARELGVTQEAASYNLRKIKERAISRGPLLPLLAGAADAGLGNLVLVR